MSNITIKALTINSAIFATLILAAPSASAQGVPAGLLRLDSAQASNDTTRLTEAEQAKLRSAYAHVRKRAPAQ